MASMTLRNKALALILVFVFAVTSVFNTGMAFAETSETTETAGLQLIRAYSYTESVTIQEIETPAFEDNVFTFEIPSNYAGGELTLDVQANADSRLIVEEDGELIEKEYYEYSMSNLESGGSIDI